MKRVYITFVCVMLIVSHNCHAQSQSTIENVEWSSQGYKDNTTSELGTGNFSFTTSSNRFTMSNGQRTLTFSVDKIDGTWDDLESNGELICRIRSGERLGVVTVGRNQERLFITIDFSTYKDGMNRTFSIDSFNRL